MKQFFSFILKRFKFTFSCMLRDNSRLAKTGEVFHEGLSTTVRGCDASKFQQR